MSAFMLILTFYKSANAPKEIPEKDNLNKGYMTR